MANKDKRVPKNVNLKIDLTEEQKKVGETVFHNDVTFVEGTYGSGKTLACVGATIKEYRKRRFEHIVIMRPFIVDKGLGALPGGILEKLYLELSPILDNFNICQGQEETNKMLEEGSIKPMYNGKIKGNTFHNSIVIVDEATDLTYSQFIEVLSRLGKNSKIIFIVSKEQIHPSIGGESCYYKIQHLKDTEHAGWVTLTANHRNSKIHDIVNYLKEK